MVVGFPKFCKAYPTTALDAATTTAEFIEKVILTEGAPTNMQSDYAYGTYYALCPDMVSAESDTRH